MKKIKVLMLVMFFVVTLISTTGLFAGEKGKEIEGGKIGIEKVKNSKTINILLLYLDLSVCDPCQGTESTLKKSIDEDYIKPTYVLNIGREYIYLSVLEYLQAEFTDKSQGIHAPPLDSPKTTPDAIRCATRIGSGIRLLVADNLTIFSASENRIQLRWIYMYFPGLVSTRIGSPAFSMHLL